MLDLTYRFKFVIFATLISLAFACSESSSNIYLGRAYFNSKSIIYLQQLRKPTALQLKAWSKYKEQYADRVYFIKPIENSAEISGLKFDLAIILVSDSIQENRALQAKIISAALKPYFRVALVEYSIPFGVSPKFTTYSHLALLNEVRTVSFAKLPKNVKARIVKGEDEKLLQRYTSIQISSNWVYSHGTAEITRIIGLLNNTHWGKITLDGGLARILKRVKKSQVTLFKNVKSKDMASLLN